MDIIKAYATNNDCFKKNQKMPKGRPEGIVVHSTGVNNPYLKRYVDAPNEVGVNRYGNTWNQSGVSKCVHAFIGYDKDKRVRVANILPYDTCCWGCGNGAKGSYNYRPAYIQFEICEDDLTNDVYFTEAFDLAIEYCAYLVDEFDIPIENIVSHHEANGQGYASNHGDCDHWLKKFGKTMDWFRSQVKSKLEPKPEAPGTDVEYVVVKGDSLSRIASRYGTTWQKLAEYNNISNPSLIRIGQVIKIPGAKPADPKPVEPDNTVNVYYRVKTQRHGWLSEVKNLDDFAGWQESPIIGLAVRTDRGFARYRVHVKGGGWLNWITKCDIEDYYDGYAGNNKPIDAVQVFYCTPEDIRPFKKAVYHVGTENRKYYGWQHDTDTDGGQDGYAGVIGGDPLTKIQIKIE